MSSTCEGVEHLKLRVRTISAGSCIACHRRAALTFITVCMPSYRRFMRTSGSYRSVFTANDAYFGSCMHGATYLAHYVVACRGRRPLIQL